MDRSPPPRRSILPKELDDIDAGWGEEQPTVPRQKASLAQHAPEPFELEESADEDRPTTIPSEPPENFARRIMGGAQSNDFVFQGEVPTKPGLDEDFFDRPTAVGGQISAHPSQIPTAPPPAGFAHERIKTVPRSPTLDNLFALADQVELNERSQSASLVERLRRSVTPIARVDVEERTMETEPPATARPGKEVRDASAQSNESVDMKNRFALGDFSGALSTAENILAKSPENSEARGVVAKCREVLFDMYSSRIGDFTLPVRVTMSGDQIRWLSLDHRSGFLLSMVDGMSTVDELLDISGMPRLDALRILAGLVEQKVVSIGR